MHLRAYGASYASLLPGILYFSAHFTVGANATPSLPYTLWIIVKGDFTPRRGDLVAFRWHGGGPIRRAPPLSEGLDQGRDPRDSGRGLRLPRDPAEHHPLHRGG